MGDFRQLQLLCSSPDIQVSEMATALRLYNGVLVFYHPLMNTD